MLAQLQTIDITGQVLSPDDAPVRGARIIAMDVLGAVVASAQSDDKGRFVLHHLSSGDYWLRAEIDDMRSGLQRLSARTGATSAPTLRLVPQAQETVEVAGAETPPPDARITPAGETVRQLGGRLRTRSLQATIATTPGWSAEDNGLLHFRGVDDGYLYVLDGIPVYERLDPLFGLAPSAEASRRTTTSLPTAGSK